MLENFTTDTFTYEKLSKDEMERRGILGRLVGVIADSKNPTRNNRLYNSILWDKVFEDPIMKEKIENNCVFGECNHPADREEVDIEKIAICMDGVPKKNSKGQLMGVFNILNTPCGRILKSLCDYGCRIGISSRGTGDIIKDFNGNDIVDPDTYTCECWDAVIVPSVKEARLDYITESLNKTRYNKTLKQKLTESINKEDENNQRIMRESLHDIGIDLDESLFDESVEYEPKFIDGMTIDELKAEEKEYYDAQYQYGRSLPMNRIWDIDYTIKELEKNSLNESLEVPELTNSINGVMASYQNVNKWLDSVKEFIYSDLSCPFFSSFVHELAHTMPGRFDKFGDILHTMNIEIPYPTTLELDNELTSIDDAFAIIFGCLDDIKANLNNFIELTDKDYHGMACSAEELLNDIEQEYPMLFRLRDKWNQCNGDLVDFDKFVAQYVEHKEDLLESLSYDEVKKNAIEAAKRDGYDQIITVDKDGNYGITRDYPNNNFEDFGETQVAKIKTSYKDGVQHIDIEESLNENFRTDNKESLINVDFDDISIGDLIYVTNGMYDVCVGDVLKKHIDTDSKGRFLYGCDVNIIVPLDSHLKVGMQTIEWKYSKDAFELFTGDLESLKKKYISTLEESVDKDILVYDSEAAKTDLFDVVSPQEMADTFNKSVKDGDKIYCPQEKVEEQLENITYKNTDIIENEDGTFSVTINDEAQVFNSLKNAKTYIDMMQPHLKEELYVSAGKMNDELLGKAVKEFSDNAGDYGDALTFVKDKFSQYSLNDQKDIARYINNQLSENLKLNEEQVGRDGVEPSKSIEEVGSEDNTPEPIPEPEKKEEKETTIIIKEDLNSTEENAADASISEIKSLDEDDVDKETIRNIVAEIVNKFNNSEDVDPLDFEEADYFKVLDYVENKLEKDVNNIEENIEDIDNLVDLNEAVDNNEAEIDKIYEMFNSNKELEHKLTTLQEQLSASYARETKLKEELDHYKNRVQKLAESSKEVEALKIKLEKANSHISEMENGISANEHKFNESLNNSDKVRTKLTESIRQRDSKIKSLEEEIESIKEQNMIRINENKALQKENDSLQESCADATKNIAQLREQYSKKLEQKNELIEKYQKIANRAVDKYIDSQAIKLGVTSNEIRNKLPKGYGFKDIDSVCESLQEYKLNMSTLPFGALSLNEGVNLKARNVRKELLPINTEDEITDLELELAKKMLK